MRKKFMRLSIVRRWLTALVLVISVLLVAFLVATLTTPPFCYSACEPSMLDSVSHVAWQIVNISGIGVGVVLLAGLVTWLWRSRTGRPPLA